MNKKKETLMKYGTSIILFIVGCVVTFLILENYTLSARLKTSFLVGWLAGGTIWGWSLTKKWFPNFSWFYNSNNNSSVGAFQLAAHNFGVGIRVTTAFVVGSVALPVSIIIAIVTTAKIGKEAYDKAYNEAVSKAEAEKNSQENASTE